MKEYLREYPLFSLCGLNCGLCPRYHTQGSSKCPGCGGADFHLKHPACPVITCSKKHDNVAYCFECSAFPCERYTVQIAKDSFISYKNRGKDMEKAKNGGIIAYQQELNEKIEILTFLIEHYDDGRRKNFFCVAVNLLQLCDIRDIMKAIEATIAPQDITRKDKAAQVVALFEQKAKEQNLALTLRK